MALDPTSPPEAASAAPASAPEATASSPPDAASTAPAEATASSLLRAALATWLRYVVPLTVLSALALAPLIVIALRVRAPTDPAAANAIAATGWTMIGFAWLPQLVLVGGAAAMIRSRVSQLRALGGGLVQLGRAVVPCLAAAVAIAIGGLALAVPGLALLVLLALTGASRQRGVAAALADSIAVARARLPAVALAVAAMLALDAAIGVAAYLGFFGALPRQPTPAQLAAVGPLARAIAAALVIVSPLPACVLAAIRAGAEPRAG